MCILSKSKCLLLFSLVLFSQITFAKNVPLDDRTIFQVAPISALDKGVYDGNFTYGELKQHGDFGLGTFKDLDGEMLALDGKFYQMLDDGHLKIVDNAQIVPFAEVSYFIPTIKNKKLAPEEHLGDLENSLLDIFPNKNVPYAIKIEGTFRMLKFRVVRKQTPPFNKSLAEAAKTEAIFDLKNVKGVLVGYWFPAYLSNIAVSGFHLHFIDTRHHIGGHVLALYMSNGSLSMEQMTGLNMYFPNTKNFRDADLADKNILNDINKAEKSH